MGEEIKSKKWCDTSVHVTRMGSEVRWISLLSFPWDRAADRKTQDYGMILRSAVFQIQSKDHVDILDG